MGADGARVILFVVLVIGFFYQLTHKGNIGVLLGFFMVPIAMIGYPSLQSIQISDNKVSLEKKADAVLANPADTTARKELQQQVEKLQKPAVFRSRDVDSHFQGRIRPGQ